MIRIKKVDVPFYYGKLTIVIAKDLRKAMKKVKEEIEKGFVPENYDAFVTWHIKNNYHNYTVFLKPNATAPTIAHEALHLSNRILHDINHTPTFINDEPQAYLLGWIVKEIYKTLKT